MRKNIFTWITIPIVVFSCSMPQNKTDRLAKASRENKNGWIYVHLEGAPSDIGYQHGYLLATTSIPVSRPWLIYSNMTHTGLEFLSAAAKNFLWTKLDQEYKDEINGIVEGLHAKKKNYDSLDITAYNAMEELAYYYVPMLDDLINLEAVTTRLPAIAAPLLQLAAIQKMGKL